jgi:hypothetical protein
MTYESKKLIAVSSIKVNKPLLLKPWNAGNLLMVLKETGDV